MSRRMMPPPPGSTRERYGLASFFAAAVSVFLGVTIAWVSCPYVFLALYFAPILCIEVVVALVLVTVGGLARQAGRGLSIGLLSLPLSALTVWSAYLIG